MMKKKKAKKNKISSIFLSLYKSSLRQTSLPQNLTNNAGLCRHTFYTQQKSMVMSLQLLGRV